MAQVFMSYASADRERAMELAKRLAERGWSVFWDRAVPPGREFDEVIGEALKAAQCVVVLWSNASVHSRWVKEEADEAVQRGILVPALIDDVALPLGFRRLQAVGLVGWPSRHDPIAFEMLLESIRQRLAHEQTPAVPSDFGSTPSSPRLHVARESAVRHMPPATSTIARRRRWSAAILLLSVGGGSAVGIWSQLYNSDVGFMAAVPIWAIGMLTLWFLWSRRT